ncbi:MAG: o-succinylbenzoate synthase [Endozoicomonas sp.]
MTIGQARIYKYRLPLVRPLLLKQFSLSHREGLILELLNADGRIGYGEAAPLVGFSRESIDDSFGQLVNVLPGLCQQAKDSGAVDYMDQLLPPSAAFAIEGALHSLNAPQGEMRPSVSPLLSGDCRSIVSRLQAWSNSWPAEFKLKVGRQARQEDIKTVGAVLDILPESVKLRLDANRGWTTADVCCFAREVAVDRISYIEEPTLDASGFSRLYQETGLHYALDESVQEPGFVLRPEPGLAALVIKPTLVGGIRRIRTLTNDASLSGVRTVFSSAFESQIGVSLIARLSAELVPGEEPGLDTLSAFARPLCQALPEPGASLPSEVFESMELLWQF